MSKLDPIQRDAQRQFDRQSERYGRSHILADTTDVAAALEHVPPAAGRRALDVACGAGHTGLFLAEHGWQVTLADIAPGMLTQAQTLAAERGLSVDFSQQTAEQFPQADASVDLVTCRVAAHHFSDPAAFVREAARALSLGGSLLVIDGSVPDDEPVAEEWLHQVEKLRDGSHNRFLPPRVWRTLCEQAGLSVVWWQLSPFKQPDLNWYFETAATSPENRQAVQRLIDTAPAEARQAFGLAVEKGKTVWWWPRLSLVAVKGGR